MDCRTVRSLAFVNTPCVPSLVHDILVACETIVETLGNMHLRVWHTNVLG